MFFYAVIILFILSFIWAWWSLYREQKTHKHVQHARRELQKEKILFKR